LNGKAHLFRSPVEPAVDTKSLVAGVPRDFASPQAQDARAFDPAE
jgi:hypothetical protein